MIKIAYIIFIIAGSLHSTVSLALSPAELAALQNELTANKADRRSSATAGYAQLIGFISDAAISGYTLNVNNAEGNNMAIFKLPMEHQFDLDKKWNMFWRGGFNYASINSENLLHGISRDKVEPYSQAYSALTGISFMFPMNSEWSFTPAFDIGVARINNDVHYEGADALQAKPLIESLLINWSTDASLASGVLGVDYRHVFARDSLNIKASYVHTYISSFNESGNFGGFSDNTDAIHLNMDYTHPLNSAIAGYPLSGIVHVGNTRFLGDNRYALGFSHLSSFGYALRTNLDQKITSFTLGFNYLRGEHADGYELVFDYKT